MSSLDQAVNNFRLIKQKIDSLTSQSSKQNSKGLKLNFKSSTDPHLHSPIRKFQKFNLLKAQPAQNYSNPYSKQDKGYYSKDYICENISGKIRRAQQQYASQPTISFNSVECQTNCTNKSNRKIQQHDENLEPNLGKEQTQRKTRKIVNTFCRLQADSGERVLKARDFLFKKDVALSQIEQLLLKKKRILFQLQTNVIAANDQQAQNKFDCGITQRLQSIGQQNKPSLQKKQQNQILNKCLSNQQQKKGLKISIGQFVATDPIKSNKAQKGLLKCPNIKQIKLASKKQTMRQ